MLALAEHTMNSQARNMLLSDYLLMTGQNYTPLVFGNPEFAFAHIQDDSVKLMPMDTLHRIMAVNLQASKADTGRHGRWPRADGREEERSRRSRRTTPSTSARASSR